MKAPPLLEGLFFAPNPSETLCKWAQQPIFFLTLIRNYYSMVSSGKNEKRSVLPLVAIGTSAGGLVALKQLFAALPKDLPLSFLVIQHLSPDYSSKLPELLAEEASYHFKQAEAGEELEQGMVYVAPSGHELTIESTVIRLKPISKPRQGPQPSVDACFSSIADNPHIDALGVVLSGTGTDGTAGAMAMQKHGHRVIAQSPEEARYDGMPLSLIHSQVADWVEPISGISRLIGQFAQGELPDREVQLKERSGALAQIIDLIYKRYQRDLSHYKTPTLLRRIEKRMGQHQIKEMPQYLEFLRKHRQEQDSLIRDLLIGVTYFFRDEKSFAALQKTLAVQLEKKKKGSLVRIWIPGCSTGEEAVSIAILLNEILGSQVSNYRWQIFATDINEKAIEQARSGNFKAEQLASLPDTLKERYFRKYRGQWRLLKKVQAMILFSVHDLQSNPPFLRLDLISCRNLLIYLEPDLQKKILSLFHYSLNRNGVLFLGKSENVTGRSEYFKPIDRPNRIYQPVGTKQKVLPSLFDQYRSYEETERPAKPLPTAKDNLAVTLGKSLLTHSSDGLILVDSHKQVLEMHGEIGRFFTFPSGGFQGDLLHLIKDELKIETRAVFNEVIKSKAMVRSRIIHLKEIGYLRINALPAANDTEELYLIQIERLDLGQLLPSERHASSADHEKKQLEYELASVKEHLQAHIEELESSNEELQSLNEELQSSSEEMQSLNEELETSNEELQSTNQEMQIAYDQLRQKNQEIRAFDKQLKHKKVQLKALTNNNLQGLILVDKVGEVEIFNKRANQIYQELFGIKLQEKQNLFELIATAEKETFRTNFQIALDGKTYQAEQSFHSIKGQQRHYSVQYTPAGLKKGEVQRVAIALMDVTDLKTTLHSLNQQEQMIQSVFKTVDNGIAILDEEAKVIDSNDKFSSIFGWPKKDLNEQPFSLLVAPENREKVESHHQRFLKDPTQVDLAFVGQRNDGARLQFESTSTLLPSEGRKFRILSIRDVTVQRSLEAQKQAVQDGLPGVIFQYQVLPDGRDKISDVNGDAKSMWGISAASVMKDAGLVWKRIHPEDRPRLRESIKESAANLSLWQDEWRVQLPNGQVIWHRGTGKPQVVEDGIIAWNTMLLDVTSEKEARSELSRSEERLREAVDLVQLGYYEMDLESTEMNWTERVYKIFGVDQESAPSMRVVMDRCHPEDRELLKQAMDQASQAQDIQEFEFRIQVEGELRWILAKGRVDAEAPDIYRGTVQDITAQRLEEERLRLMSSVVHNSTDPIIITDTNRGSDGPKIIYANDSFLALSGYTEKELIGRTPKILQGKETDRQAIDKMRQDLDQWEASSHTVLNYRKNGEPFWNHLKMIPVKAADGWVSHWIAIERDVTDEVERESQVQLYHDMSHSFVEKENLNQSIKLLCQKLIDSSYFDLAELWLVNETEKFMRLESVSTAHRELTGIHQDTLSFRMGQGLPGRVWATGELISIDDIENSRWLAHKEQVEKSGLNEIYVLPLWEGDRVNGCLLLGSRGNSKLNRNFRFLFTHIQNFLGAEIARKKLEEDLSTIYNTVPDIICTASLSGYFLKINRAASDLLGYSLEELRSLPITSFVHPEDVAHTQAELGRLNRGEATPYFENRYVTKSGKIIWLAWTANVERESKKVYAVAKNITEEKELKVLLDEATNMAEIGAFRFEMKDDYFQWSPLAERFHLKPGGYFAENVDFLKQVYPRKKHRELMQNALRQVRDHLQVFDVEVIAKGQDGVSRWLRIIGEPILFEGQCKTVRGSIQNIDVRKKAELKAVAALEEKQDILESIGDGFISLNRENKVFYWNKKAENWLKIKRQDALEKSLENLLPDLVGKELLQHMEEARRTKNQQQCTTEWRNQHLEFSIYPVSLSGLSVFIQDVTDRVHYVEEIETRNRRLSEIAYTQSHTVRAPLARIMGLAGLLEDQPGDERERAELIARIIDESKSLDQVIRSIVRKTQTDTKNV